MPAVPQKWTRAWTSILFMETVTEMPARPIPLNSLSDFLFSCQEHSVKGLRGGE